MNIFTVLLVSTVIVCTSQFEIFSRRKDVPCSRPVLENGRVKLKSGARIAKFSCDKGFFLLGEIFSTCVRGQWSTAAPVCASKKCSKPKPPDNGRIVFTVFGSVMFVECNPGYVLSGTRVLYCDGEQWNGTVPVCLASGSKPSLSCDFEQESICGWAQDSNDDFDWIRLNSATPSGHVGTGPSFDKTRGQGQSGYFMYIEASAPRIENDTARLFSPVYGPDAISDGCFIFHYHMYGATTGRLNVYVKPESLKLSEIKASFTRTGDQGNHWRQGYFPLPEISENFQIVIEGVRGPSYVSDTAIDDVILARGEQCRRAAAQDVDGYIVTPASIAANSSCKSFCGFAKSDSRTCDCHSQCKTLDTCCSDFADFCFEGGMSTIQPKTTATTPKANQDVDREDGDNSDDGDDTAVQSSTTTTTTTTPSGTVSTSSVVVTTTPSTTTATTTTTPTTTSSVTNTPVLSTTTTFPIMLSSSTVTSTTTTTPTTTTGTTTTTTAATTTITTPTTTTSTTTATTSTVKSTTSATTTTPTTTTKTTTTTTTRRPQTSTVKPSTTPTTPTTTATTTKQTTPSTTTTSVPTTKSTTLPTRTTTVVVSKPSTENPDAGTSSLNEESSPGGPQQPTSSDSTRVTLAVTLGPIAGVLVIVLVIAAMLRLNGYRLRSPKRQEHLPEDSDFRWLNTVEENQIDLASPEDLKFTNIEQL